MEQVNFGYSLKNIPIPENRVYLQMLINSAEKVTRSIRWRDFHFLNPKTPGPKKETYGFNSTKPAPIVPEMKEFEKEMLDLVMSVEFNKKTNPFQEKLKKDAATIKADSKLFIAADKTSNYYKISVEDHPKLLEDNNTKDYKKTNIKVVDKTNMQI